MRNIILSFFDITKCFFFNKKPYVIFYYPQHFNRSSNGTNPFFDIMLNTCENNDISYKVLEEPDNGTDKPRNGNAIKGDFLYIMVLVIRKILRFFCRNSTFLQIEIKTAKIIDLLSFHRFRAPVYISISGSLNEFFLALNPEGKVFEVQHGIVFSGKDSFFEPDGTLHPGYKNKRFYWFFWGNGYAESVMKGNEKEMKNRVFVTGYPLAQIQEFSPKSIFNEKIVLISVRFTTDYSKDILQKKKEYLMEFIDELKDYDVKVLIKHHPRYNNVISLDDVYEKYDFVSVTNEDLSSLQKKIFLQVTTDSTTAFEYAEVGILTFFYSNDSFRQKDNLFYKEYNYPLYYGMSIKEVLSRLKDESNYKNDSETIRKWYNKFYTPFNELVFLKSILNEK